MADVTVFFRDGSQQVFQDRGAPGGSYSNQVRYIEGVVEIENPYGRKTAFPLDLVLRVETASERRGW